jgi:hypothetical protein
VNQLQRRLRDAVTVDISPSTAGGALVALCVAHGSPVVEQARVVMVPELRLMGAVFADVLLSPIESDALAVWADCLAWRTWWRMGLAGPMRVARLVEVERAALSLPWVPVDWRLDYERAVAGERAEVGMMGDAVDEILAAVAAGERQVDVARRFGVSQPRVSQLVRRARG